MPTFNVLNSKYLKALLYIHTYIWLDLVWPKHEQSSCSCQTLLLFDKVCTWWRQNKSHFVKNKQTKKKPNEKMSCRCWFSIDRSLLLPWLGVYSWRDGGARFQSWDCHYVIITCSISTLLASSLLLMNLLGLWHQNGAKTKTRWDAVRFVWQLTTEEYPGIQITIITAVLTRGIHWIWMHIFHRQIQRFIWVFQIAVKIEPHSRTLQTTSTQVCQRQTK